MHDDDGEWRMVFCFCLRTKTDDSSEFKPRLGLGFAAHLDASCCTCGNDASKQTRTHSPARASTQRARWRCSCSGLCSPANILKLSDRCLCGRSQVVSARLAHQCKCWPPSKHGTKLYKVWLHLKRHPRWLQATMLNQIMLTSNPNAS